MIFVDEINILLSLHKIEVEIKKNMIEKLKNEIETTSQNDRDYIKNLKGNLNGLSTELNKCISDHQNMLGDKIIDYLFEIEENKIDGKLDHTYYKDVLYLYNILSSECSRNHARYVKMPKDWILLGFMSGFLEDLVVVMRTLSQTSISKTHLVTLTDLIQNYKTYCNSDNPNRFPFITKLFTQNIDIVRNYITNSIKSQSKSKRIGMYSDADGNEYYYSIQGLLGNMEYDSRVVKTLDRSNCPKYAVHFTKSDIAKKIWLKEKTSSVKGERELPVGTICRFQRSIHALFNKIAKIANFIYKFYLKLLKNLFIFIYYE